MGQMKRTLAAIITSALVTVCVTLAALYLLKLPLVTKTVIQESYIEVPKTATTVVTPSPSLAKSDAIKLARQDELKRIAASYVEFDD